MGRAILYLSPSFRSVGVGTALLLERPAAPGWRGAAADLGRVIQGGWGSASLALRAGDS